MLVLLKTTKNSTKLLYFYLITQPEVMVLFWYKIDHCVKRAVGAECLKRRIILWAIFMQKGNWNNGSQPHCKADFIITKTKDGGNNNTTYHTPYTSIVLYKIVRKLKKWIYWTTGTLNLYNLGNFAFHKNFLGFLKSTYLFWSFLCLI